MAKQGFEFEKAGGVEFEAVRGESALRALRIAIQMIIRASDFKFKISEAMHPPMLCRPRRGLRASWLARSTRSRV